MVLVPNEAVVQKTPEPLKKIDKTSTAGSAKHIMMVCFSKAGCLTYALTRTEIL